MRPLAKYLLVILIGGCGSSPPATKPGPPPAADQPQDAAPPKSDESKSAKDKDTEQADLTGRITLNGAIPGPRKPAVNKDEEVCGVVDTVRDVIGSDGGVAGVVIEIKGVEGSDWTWKDPAGGYVIRQKDCHFVPNMIVIPNGKEISVHNDDPIGHNVNTGDWNQMQPAGSDPIVRPVEGKMPVKIGCNIHSWMEGWIYPVHSPFYAVTGEQGDFSINGIPPGKYRVTIWHPHLGRKTERVTLRAGKAEKLNHVFESK